MADSRCEQVHEHRPLPRPPPPIERTWVEPPDAWLQPHLAASWSLGRGVKDHLTALLHEARVDKRIGGGGEALVELQTELGGELHAALVALGPELNDLLGVSATRLTQRVPGASEGEAAREADAASAAARGADAASEPTEESKVVAQFDGVLKASSPQSEHALRILVWKTTAPKCPRCWRYVPLVAALDDAESAHLDGGWRYRGHPDGECKRWVPSAVDDAIDDGGR